MISTFENKRNFIKILLDVSSIFFMGIFASFFLYFRLETKIFDIIIAYSIFYVIMAFLKNEIPTSWRFTDSRDVLEIIKINIFTFLIILSYNIIFGKERLRVLILIFLGAISLQLLMRMIFRLNRQGYIFLGKKNITKKKKRAIIYGAGEAGNTLIRESRLNENFEYKICALLDDEINKQQTIINGIKVYGGINEIENIIKKLKIDTVIIAIPSIDIVKLNKIYDKIKSIENIEIKKLPFVSQLIEGNLSNQIKNVSIEDLLGRDEVQINTEEIRKYLEGATILVTGGGGSIGSELSRQLAKYNPKKLINLDINENTLYLLELEIKRNYPGIDLVSEICSIRDRKKLDEVFAKYRPDIVFHAAAHKHVPLMEHNPEEAIKNNIFGTKNLVDIVDKYKVKRFVMISTDKAVNPTNIMGASKRACELIVEKKNEVSETKFMAVRFGNVLGSNGSVIPIFRKLIEEGKNLTVTHKDMKRYFMTIPEASQLVIEAGVMGKGGELFILDMGEPVKIMDLAKNMIKLSNANVGIDVVGLRPGEKLYEELMYDTNSAIKTENNKIFITKLEKNTVDVDYYLEKLKEVLVESNKEEIKNLMKKFITTYKEIKY